MKKSILLIIPLILILSGCTVPQEVPQNVETKPEQYIKSIWITYYELQDLIKDTESEFNSCINSKLTEIKDMGFNTITVQVRPCADAFYKSNLFPSSKYCFKKQGSDMPYDPFKIICNNAKLLKLNVEAWINPYRVSQDNKINSLCDSNIAKKWYKSKDKKSNVYITDNAIYFNPASKDVTDLIVSGVEEIVKSYDIYSIHFDDYFYPTTKKDIDALEYKNSGSNQKLSDWRRNNVSNMIKAVYKTIKSINKDVKFGISPASNIDDDYSKLYADVTEWVTNEGYIDYICPQVYFGFKNVYQPFMFTVKKWCYITNCDMYIGLPLYKCGRVDNYAAQNDKSIKNEFVNSSNIISRQITYLSKIEKVKGFYIFSYGSLFDKKCKAEVENMLKSMQSSNPH